MMQEFVYVYSSVEKIGRVVCKSLGAYFFRIELGILSRPGALLLLRLLRQSRMFFGQSTCARGFGVPFFLSIVYPSKSCNEYCLTPHVQCSECVF